MQRSLLEPLIREVLEEEVAGYECYPWTAQGHQAAARKIAEAIEAAEEEEAAGAKP